jgi:hypothetical protein
MSDQPLELRLRRIHRRHRQELFRRVVSVGIWSVVLVSMATLVVAMSVGFVQK